MITLLYVSVALFIFGNVCVQNSLSKVYIYGFALHYGLFTFCYSICVFLLRSRSLKMLFGIFHIAMIPFIVVGILYAYRNRKTHLGIVTKMKQVIRGHNVIIYISLVLIVIQVMRLGLMQPFAMSDSKPYYSIIRDMIHYGEMYGYDDVFGMPASTINPKYLLTSWYVYLAYWCMVGNAHMLVFLGTIFPMCLLIMYYFVSWSIAELIFDKQENRWLFLLISALISEAQLVFVDEAAYRLVWPVWGKSYTCNFAIPLIAIIIIQMVKENDGIKQSTIKMTLVSFIGTFASANGMMTIPVLIGTLGLVFMIYKKTTRFLVPCFVAIVPEILQFVLYYLYSRGGLAL